MDPKYFTLNRNSGVGPFRANNEFYSNGFNLYNNYATIGHHAYEKPIEAGYANGRIDYSNFNNLKMAAFDQNYSGFGASDTKGGGGNFNSLSQANKGSLASLNILNYNNSMQLNEFGSDLNYSNKFMSVSNRNVNNNQSSNFNSLASQGLSNYGFSSNQTLKLGNLFHNSFSDQEKPTSYLSTINNILNQASNNWRANDMYRSTRMATSNNDIFNKYDTGLPGPTRVSQPPALAYHPTHQSSVFDKGFMTSDNEFIPASRVMRKLGFNERLFHGESTKTRNYIYRSVLLTSEFDLYKYLDIVEQAIDEWKLSQPLLRAKIVQRKLNESQNTYANREYYFVESEARENRSTSSHKNVQFLYYKSNSPQGSVCDEIWKLFVERESTINLDENGLLWRLSFMKLRNSTNTSTPYKFNFIIVATFEHSIMDGRSSYSSLLQLLAIIENLFVFNYKREKEFRVLPPKEEVFKYRRETADPVNKIRTYLPLPRFLVENPPPLYDNLNSRQPPMRFKNITQTDAESGHFYTHDHQQVVSIRDLIEISKKVNSKFRTLLIRGPDLAKLMAKCKEKGVKMTSFINMALIYAIRILHEKNEREWHKKAPQVNYVTNVSLREFPEFHRQTAGVEANQPLGCYVSILFNIYNEPNYFNLDGLWISEFWRDARNDTLSIHERLKRGDVFNPNRLPVRKIEPNEFFYHFSNSNLGVLKSSLTERKLIKIKQTFASGRYSRENSLCWFSNFLATIDNELSWTISFNNAFIKPETIDSIIENLVKLLATFMK